jgi:proline iminopeptidase
MNRTEGYVEVPGGHVWYEINNPDSNGVPLLCLHGGPGYPHDYLETFADLAVERPVIFYDQLGCGNSERPTDKGLWVKERFVDELVAVREALGLKQIHLLGQSWGTMLSIEYHATKKVEGVISQIFASPCTSIPMWIADAEYWRQQLPKEVLDVMLKHEKAGTTDSPEYAEAIDFYYHRHVCQLDPWPIGDVRANFKASMEVYNTMWGPSEFYMVGGNLIDFDRTGALKDLTMPVLWTCGQYDECRPETLAYYHSLTPNSEMHVFENASHTAHLEQRVQYMAVLSDFLERVERKAGIKNSTRVD